MLHNNIMTALSNHLSEITKEKIRLRRKEWFKTHQHPTKGSDSRKLKTCQFCKKEFKRYTYSKINVGKFCSQKCHYESVKGKPTHIKFNIDIKKKIRDARLKQVFPFKDTSIEVKLQEGLKKLNIPFETHKIIEGFVQCDIFIEPSIVIFVDGCYFHGCQVCYLNRTKLDATQNKNVIRDALVNQFFNNLNGKYKVLRFWEHDILNNFESNVLDEIIFAVNKNEKCSF